MTYEELKKVIAAYLIGTVDKRTLEWAFGLWQRKEFGSVA